MSSESSSESEISACSSKFDPVKALYADKPKLPVDNAPLYDNLQQFEAALKYDSLQSTSIIPVGHHELVNKREEEKENKKKEQERLLQEKNKQRFAQYEGMILRLCFYFCHYLTLLALYYNLIKYLMTATIIGSIRLNKKISHSK